MSGKTTCLAELRAKKQELLIESELNRVQMLRDWSSLKTSVRQLANPLRAAKMLAGSTATAATAIAVFRRIYHHKSQNGKRSWIGHLASGAKLGASIIKLVQARRQKA